MLLSWDYGLAIVNTISQLLHSGFQSAADGLATDNLLEDFNNCTHAVPFRN